MADTRKDKRAPVSLKVRFKSATVDEFIEQYCRDVSRGGIFIKSSQPMPIGTLLKFQLQLKDESSLIKGVGRVVWTRSEDDASSEAPAGMGIKFIKMDGESRVVVDRIVGGHSGEPGTFDQGEVSVDGASPSNAPPSNGSGGGSGGGFFPNLPPAVLPPPEDRTAVRHAAQFLASALSESGTDAAASREAEQKAEEAQRRTVQIQAQRVAEAEQKKKAQSGEALPSMIIDPSLSIPPPPASAAANGAASVDEDRPTHTDPKRAPTSDRPTAHKEKPKAKAAPKAAPRLAVSEPPPEDTSITERKKVDVATLAAAADAARTGAKKKSNALPYFVIAAVVAVAAFLALQDKAEVVEEAAVIEPAVQQQAAEPEPVLPTPAPEPEPAPVPAVEPAAVAEPAPEPVALVAVKVATVPDGAEIFVGDESRGTAPLTLELPKGAPVTIRARSAGRAEATQELTPEDGQKAIKLSLAALPYVLHVETAPAGAIVFVGVKRGITPVDLELPGPPKGPLKVTARLVGHEVGIAIVAASSFEEREGALRSSVALTLNEHKPAVAPEVAPKPVAKPRPITKPDPEPAELAPTSKPVEAAPAPKPVEAAPAPKPVEAAPKPAAKPKTKPEATPKPKPEPGSEPIPDNPFG